jgi:predicted metallo-beta-lactamase superfamily hydrolase
MRNEELMELYSAKIALLEEMEEVLAQSQEISTRIQEINNNIDEVSADEE